MTDAQKLVKARLISIFYSVSSFAVIIIPVVITSSEFQTFIQTHIKSSLLVSILLLAIPEVAKHFRNLTKMGKLGARADNSDFIII